MRVRISLKTHSPNTLASSDAIWHNIQYGVDWSVSTRVSSWLIQFRQWAYAHWSYVYVSCHTADYRGCIAHYCNINLLEHLIWHWWLHECLHKQRLNIPLVYASSIHMCMVFLPSFFFNKISVNSLFGSLIYETKHANFRTSRTHYRTIHQSDASGDARSIHSSRCLQRNKAKKRENADRNPPMQKTSAGRKKVGMKRAAYLRNRATVVAYTYVEIENTLHSATT